MENNNSEQITTENNPEHSEIFSDAFGMHEKNIDQSENIHSVLEKIGKHEEKIIKKIDETDINKLSPATKEKLSLLGRFKSIFAGKKLEQKFDELVNIIINHPVKSKVYFGLKGGEDKPDNELSRKYVEIASTGIPKIIKNESGEPIDVIDVTKYQNIN